MKPGFHSVAPQRPPGSETGSGTASETGSGTASETGSGTASETGSGGAEDGHGAREAELAAILPGITGPGGQFRHRQHINLAFYAVRRYGMPDAVGAICGWIRQIAAYERAPQKYHHTISRAWVELVAHHVATDPDCTDFDVFAERYPALLDKRLLARHYRSSTLAAGSARLGWVEPDVLPFPWRARGTAPLNEGHG